MAVGQVPTKQYYEWSARNGFTQVSLQAIDAAATEVWHAALDDDTALREARAFIEAIAGNASGFLVEEYRLYNFVGEARRPLVDALYEALGRYPTQQTEGARSYSREAWPLSVYQRSAREHRARARAIRKALAALPPAPSAVA